MKKAEKVNLGFVVEVVQGDALLYEADVLMVKHSPRAGGLGSKVRKQIQEAENADGIWPEGDEYRIYPGKNTSCAEYVLMVGAPPVFSLRYPQLRDLGRRFLEALWAEGVGAKHVVTTAHGIRTAAALDEVEAFRSLLLGMADAYAAGRYPPTLQKVTIVEQDENRVRLLQDALLKFLPESPSPEPEKIKTEEVQAIMAGPDSFQPEFRKPEPDESTPHIFVAMPFRSEYDDQFYLAIQPCIKDLGFLCERMDLDTFTGDIVDRMLDRIRSAKMLIALLDSGNPNVYLEVGYAWGVKTPTVLVAREGEALPFDVRGHRVLIYDRIYRLKEMLTEELKKL
jgi:hypothetical protein